MSIWETMVVDVLSSSAMVPRGPLLEQPADALIEGDLRFEVKQARAEGRDFERERVRPARDKLAAYSFGRSPGKSTSKREGRFFDDEWATLRFNLAVRLCALGVAQSDNTSLRKSVRLFSKAVAVAEDERLLAKAQYALGVTLSLYAVNRDDLERAIESLDGAAERFRSLRDQRQFAHARNNQGCTQKQLAERYEDAEAYRESAKLFLEADASFGHAGDTDGVSMAKLNYSIALRMCAEQTGEVADLGAAASALSQAAQYFERTADTKRFAFALFGHGVVLERLANVVRDGASSHKAAATLFARAAEAFHLSGNVDAACAARARGGVSTLTWASGGDARWLAQATLDLTTAAEGHKYTGNHAGAAWALLYKGLGLVEQGVRSKRAHHLKDAVDAFAAAVENYAICGNERDRSRSLVYKAYAMASLASLSQQEADWLFAVRAWSEARSAVITDEFRDAMGMVEQHYGSALNWYAKVTGNPEYFAESARALAAAVRKFAEDGRTRDRAVARRDRGFTLLDWAETHKASDCFRNSARNFGAAAGVFRAVRDFNALGEAKLHQGYALLRLADLTETSTDFERAFVISVEATTLCLACGNLEGRAKALLNQGSALIGHASATRTLWRFEEASKVSQFAAECHGNIGDRVGYANALSNKSVADWDCAEILNKAASWRVAADTAAEAANAYSVVGDIQGRARSQNRHAACMFQLARCSRQGKDFGAAASALAVAIEVLTQVGESEKVASVKAQYELALEASKFDKLPPLVEQEVRTIGEGAITDASEESDLPSALREEFAGASVDDLLMEINRLRTANASKGPARDFATATLDELIATLEEGSNLAPVGLQQRLGEIVRETRDGMRGRRDKRILQSLEERRRFVKKVNTLLDWYSLRFNLQGGGLARLQLMKAGTIRFGVPGDNESLSLDFSVVPVRQEGGVLTAVTAGASPDLR